MMMAGAHQSAGKERLISEEEERKENSRDRQRCSLDKESSTSGSHSRKHKRRRERSEGGRSDKEHRHRRNKAGSSGRSDSKSRKKRSSSSERRRKYSTKHSHIRKDRHNSFLDRNPGENLVASSYSPVSRYDRDQRTDRYRSRSRSPVSRYDRDRRTDEYRSRSPVSHYDRDRRYGRREEEEVYSSAPGNSRGYSALKGEIQDLLRIEHHHIAYEGKEDSNGDIQDLEWCYKYLDPSIRGHITGGRAILHHRCRQCQRICLHLLGKYGTGKRMCLACAGRERGWRKEEVPSWYFHKPGSCKHCSFQRRQYNIY